MPHTRELREFGIFRPPCGGGFYDCDEGILGSGEDPVGMISGVILPDVVSVLFQKVSCNAYNK